LNTAVPVIILLVMVVMFALKTLSANLMRVYLKNLARMNKYGRCSGKKTALDICPSITVL
jgi:hypothetical protein